MHQADPSEVEPITGWNLWQVCKNTRKTAAGLDVWAPADFALLSLGACDRLAEMLNVIEEGAAWPAEMCVAKAAFLAKDEAKALDPMEYRVLLILPTLYRTWAMTRLRDMDAWIETWATPEMHAGIRGVGAQDGWYGTAIEPERVYQEPIGHDHLTGAIADIHKCFDQVQRDIVYMMAEKAGMPKRVLRAYRSFQEALEARNAVAGIMGEAYPKPTSIPQGDPLSMMLVALIMRPWILLMSE